MRTYEIAMHRTESITVKLEAESPQQAIELAREGHSLFRTDACTELKDGEPVAEHVIQAQCENCNVMIFDAADYDKGATDPDGIFVCEQCKAALQP